MWANIVEPDRPQTTIWRMLVACWLPKVTNTLRIYHLLLSAATIVAGSCLNVTFYVHCLSCLSFPVGLYLSFLIFFTFIDTNLENFMFFP